MNAEPTNPPPDAATPADLVTAQQELTAALGSIIGRGDFWRVVSASRPLTLTHGWHDGSVDTMVISGAHAAYAYRENPSGREVHKFEGTALEVDAAIRALPAPDEPAAPDGSDHTPGPSGTWT